MPARAAGGAARGVPPAVWALLVPGLLSLGLSAVLIRLAGDAPALTLAAARTALVGALVGPVALARERAAWAALSRRDWAWTAAAGVLLGLHFAAWVASVQRTTVATASVLVTTSPLFLVAFGAALGERPGRRTLVAVAAGVAGAAVIGAADGGGGPAPDLVGGALLALVAAALVAGYLLVGRAVQRRTTALAFFAPLTVVAALTAGGVAALAGAPLALSAETWGWVALMALGPGLLGHLTFVVALRYFPAPTVGVLSLAEPVVATALGVALLGETPSGLALAGMALVLGSIAAVVTGRQAGDQPGAQPAAGRSEKRRRPRP